MKKIYLILISIFMLGVVQTNAQCFANYQYSSSNLTVQFTDSSSTPPGSAISYFWDFGNGNISGLQNPTHTYANSGTYLTCLTIYDSLSNCSDSICYNITISNGQSAPCMASYTYSVRPNGVLGSTYIVNFLGVVTSGVAPFTYSWNFGVPGSGSPNAFNTFNVYSPGVYGVTFTATDANGATCSYYDTVYVNSCSANFSSQTGSNGSVSFTNLSNPIHNQVAFDWNFGDGSPLVGTTNPTHVYTSSGTYLVTLNMYDSIGNCSSSYNDTVNVQIGTPSSCNASYTIALDSTLAFGVVLHNNSSNLASHFYSWDFGDGTTGSGRTPIHQFLTFGSYYVCLTITDTVLNCTSTFCDTVGMDTAGNLKTGFRIRVVNNTAVGIEEIDQMNSHNMFPNPASNSISLDLRNITSSLNVSVIDLSGRIVIENRNKLSGNVEKFDISNLNNGIYFMIIDIGETRKVKKFIKSE